MTLLSGHRLPLIWQVIRVIVSLKSQLLLSFVCLSTDYGILKNVIVMGKGVDYQIKINLRQSKEEVGWIFMKGLAN